MATISVPIRFKLITGIREKRHFAKVVATFKEGWRGGGGEMEEIEVEAKEVEEKEN